MSAIAEDTATIAKTKDLCAAILEDSEPQGRLLKINAFIDDEESRAQFVKLNEAGDALQRKRQAGEQLDPEEITDFKKLQETAAGNAVILESQNKLQALRNKISGYVAKTFEFDRVPTAEDFASKKGDSCGEGCGYH